ncbi:branched-chain amino acid ABC transporter substrate-binding protein [Tsukamurella sp. 8F]|uniref:branched-chain amino acid ABC transporter substrate-binding protein n=1 Tax=unclassified Tsukamurella TaxID=2633480 RepID=UPI0023BA347F|nr:MULTISPECIES: branched-chain amino acid ABC transporter substrate-binding protein [unclassified Tsukamurella]MDF0528669.1 branched-chain amino acid ABC transporter substrate-binding protein [Tsukamurella sp. 8J]MDF0585631.1 branched-chain amino acid ABC transporter substrate-binding protein [Tsukamurella sp. 8F]
MHRRLATGGVALCAAVALTLTACGSKSTSGGGGEASGGSGSAAATGLTITPLAQIDTSGKEVPTSDAGQAVLPSALGNAPCPATNIAMAGALTGDNSALGINIRNGAQLAVNQHNAANPNCKITLKSFDTEGDPQKATQVAPTITGDQSIIGLIGPAFSGETKATGSIFAQAGLVATTASATNPDLAKNGWRTFYRGLANDAVQGPAVAKYMAGKLGYKRVCVIKDDSDYGVGLAKTITEGLGSAHDASCDADVKSKERDFSAVINKLSQAKPDAIFYSGYYAEAAPLVTQMRQQGLQTVFVSGDGTNDPNFVSQAGQSAKDAYLSCPCGPAKDPFKGDYTKAFNMAPGVYSVEAYDLATILMKGIEEGKRTRPELLDYVKNYSGQGLARHYQWNAQGELTSALIWIYQVK